MPRQARQLAETGIYHVMLRGVNRDAIFLEPADHEQFLRILGLVRSASGCLVLAYCLMTNHVHLVLRTPAEPIGAVGKRLGIRYAAWFNRKYGRVGHLFQSRFASRPVEDDAYLVTLLRYVWDNPVRAGLAERPEDYRWSSRRLIGRRSSLIEEAHLTGLLPPGGLAAVVAARADSPHRFDALDPAPGPIGRPRRYTDEEVADLLHTACGTESPSGFAELDAQERTRAVRELRMRSVPYAQIAALTGLSTSSVRRMHVAAVQPDGRRP